MVVAWVNKHEGRYYLVNSKNLSHATNNNLDAFITVQHKLKVALYAFLVDCHFFINTVVRLHQINLYDSRHLLC